VWRWDIPGGLAPLIGWVATGYLGLQAGCCSVFSLCGSSRISGHCLVLDDDFKQAGQTPPSPGKS
jgi:hypothetical protein